MLEGVHNHSFFVSLHEFIYTAGLYGLCCALECAMMQASIATDMNAACVASDIPLQPNIATVLIFFVLGKQHGKDCHEFEGVY